MTIGNMYLNFLSKVKCEYTVRNSKTKLLRIRLLATRVKIYNNIARYAYIFKIDPRSYTEIKYPFKLDIHSSLMQKFVATNTARLDASVRDEAHDLRILMIEYCKMINEYRKLRLEFRYYLQKSFITYREYREYLLKYYDEVQKIILRGDIYRAGKRLGDFRIDYIKIDKHADFFKSMVNMQRTMELKRKIIANGMTPYNKVDAEGAKAAGKKYDGVLYTIYGFEIDSYFKLRWLRSNVHLSRRFKFHYYKGNNTFQTFAELASQNLKHDDIISLDTNIIHKCRLLANKDSSYSEIFRRNENYKLREYRQSNIKN